MQCSKRETRGFVGMLLVRPLVIALVGTIYELVTTAFVLDYGVRSRALLPIHLSDMQSRRSACAGYC